MKRDHKLLLFMAIIAGFVFLVILLQQQSRGMLDAFIQSEREENAQVLSGIIKLKNEGRRGYVLETTYWDELVNAVERRDVAWLDVNVRESIFIIKYDLLWIFDAKGNLIYSASSDGTSGVPDFPAPLRSCAVALSRNPVCHFFARGSPGLIEINGASIHPGDDPQRKSAPRGYMFIGKIWDAGVIGELAALSGARLSLVPATDSAPGRSGRFEARFTHHLYGWNGVPEASLSVVRGFSVIQDWNAAQGRGFQLLLVLAGLLACVVFYLIEDRKQRMRMAETLRVSEERARILAASLRLSDDAIYSIGLDGAISEWNRGAAQIFGYQEREIIGKPVIVLAPEHLQGEVLGNLEKVASGQRVEHFETVRKRKDGSLLDVSINLSPLLDEKGAIKGFCVIARDISRNKQAERQQAENLHFLQALLDSIPNPVFYKDAQGRFQGCNRAFEEYLGMSREEIVGKSFSELGPQEPADTHRKLERDLTENPACQAAEARVRYADGGIRDVIVYKASFTDMGGGVGGIVGTMSDISKIKQAEDKLRQSETRYRGLFESVQDAILLMAEGKFIDCNPSSLAMFGCSREQLVGMEPSAFSPPVQPDGRDSVEKAGEKIRAALGGEPQHFQWRHCRLDRTEFDADVNLNRVEIEGQYFLIVQVHDVTERVRAEEALRANRGFLDALLNAISDPILVKDRQHRLVMVNDAECRLAGKKREELIGKTDYDFFPKEQVDVFWKYDELVFETGREYSNEEQITGPDGQMRVYVTKKTLYTDKEGNKFLVAIIRDITERKEFERKERLAQLGKLCADMAHEVNNPLMIISGNAQLCLLEGITDGSVRKSLETIVSECQRAKEITQRLLKYSRPSKGEFRKADINSVIENMILLVEHQFGLENITVRRVYGAVPSVRMDEQQMIEVFMNLLVNSKDAMPDGGCIEISTREEKGSVRVDIADSGSGIRDEDLRRIGEPFFTTKQKGTGLGLSLCYGIVKSHGGEITFRSAVGKGTVVSIILPAAPGE